MALITVVGFPCAGKSSRAAELRDYLLGKVLTEEYTGPIKNIHIISDHSLGIPPSVYNGTSSRSVTPCYPNSAVFLDSVSEKPARGTIFTNLQRQMAVDSVLILDSLNYIKGYRYQIYCAAREMKLRTCTVRPISRPYLADLNLKLGSCRYGSQSMSGMEFPQARGSGLRRVYASVCFILGNFFATRCTAWKICSCVLKNLPPWFAGMRLYLPSCGQMR